MTACATRGQWAPGNETNPAFVISLVDVTYF